LTGLVLTTLATLAVAAGGRNGAAGPDTGPGACDWEEANWEQLRARPGWRACVMPARGCVRERGAVVAVAVDLRGDEVAEVDLDSIEGARTPSFLAVLLDECACMASMRAERFTGDGCAGVVVAAAAAAAAEGFGVGSDAPRDILWVEGFVMASCTGTDLI
jgi:hypothetical protein